MHSKDNDSVGQLRYAHKERKNIRLYIENELVSWCFKHNQPQRIIWVLRETFIKTYIAESTNKVEIRPGEQSEKAESCQENVWNKLQLKEP